MKGIAWSAAQAKAHQERHGFISGPLSSPGAPVAVPKKLYGAKEPNKTETEYGRILKARFPDCKLRFESFKFRLADGCWYVPDWSVYLPEDRPPFLMVEVKGKHIWDDSIVKFRVAKEQYPEFEWELHQKTSEGWRRLL